MYDYDFYEMMDYEMLHALKSALNAIGKALIFIVLYIPIQPARACYWIRECIENEKQTQREEKIRFRNLKRTGHI